MQALVDADTLLLRWVAQDDTEIVINENAVILPTLHIIDMGTRNAMLIKHKGDTLPGMSEDDMRGWRANNWYYDIAHKTYVMVQR